MSADENPYEPTECRECGEPVRVVRAGEDREVGGTQGLYRRCDNPTCDLNTGQAREGARP